MARSSGVVIVTGAASGLGKESAVHFAQCGATVVAVDINSAGLETIASVRIHPIVANLTEAVECKRVAEQEAIFLLSKHVIPHMAANGGGSVVNMSSVQASATQARVAAYAPPKALSCRSPASRRWTLASRTSASPQCPGTVETPLAHANARHWNPQNPAAVLAEWGSKHALNRIGQPLEVARLAAFLISDESSFITDHTISSMVACWLRSDLTP